MMNKQSQKGGDYSTNLQANQVTVYAGIDEKRSREIFKEMFAQEILKYTQDAREEANARASKFEARLFTKMDKIDGALEAFADPSFQMLLLEAQKTAASTERPVDYDLLSELLIHRFEKGDDRVARAGISLAVEIVDKISDEALQGLTVFHAVQSFIPATGDIIQGINTLNDMFEKVIYRELPLGDEWLDHLEILSAIRLISFAKLKKMSQFYSNNLSGYIDVGIIKESENHTKSLEILNKNNLPENLLVEHILNPDCLRLNITNITQIKNIKLLKQIFQSGNLVVAAVELTKEQEVAIGSIYELYSKDDDLRRKNINIFMDEWDKRPNLKIIHNWWDSIPVSLIITSVGKVLAHSNAQRCDDKLPPMN